MSGRQFKKYDGSVQCSAPMTRREEMAARLRLAREAAGFSGPAAAAAHFRWRAPAYTSHENGWRGYMKVAAQYARAFRVDEAWLLTGQGKGPGGQVSRDDGHDTLLEIYDSLPPEFRARLLDDARILRAAADTLSPDQPVLPALRLRAGEG